MFYKKNGEKAFTLIELLVVISVIGLLSSILVFSMSKIKIKSQDTRRQVDISQIVKALALYYQDNKKFPCKEPFDLSTNSDFLQPLVTGNYLAKNPKDPVNNSNYLYEYGSFKSIAGGACGQIVFLGVKFANSGVSCPASGKMSTSDNHCHIMFPQGLPPPCTSPYLSDDDFPYPSACNNLFDNANDY